tara:strand:+ start:3149 stop:3754 length:606 start_codon:yes stop_codon:yes gene_type:complete
MGFLDNSTVTVDAILTKRGRELLSKGQDLNITKFALSDEEIDYTLYDVTHPNGSDSYGAVIENMSILEAAPNRTDFNSFLIDTSLQGRKLTLGNSTSITNLTAGDKPTITPTTDGGTDETYTFFIANRGVVQFENQKGATLRDSKQAILVAQSFSDEGGASTTVTVRGNKSMLVKTVVVTVKKDPTATTTVRQNKTTADIQ